MNRPLRVMIVDHTAELGGAELALLRLMAALSDDIEVEVALFSDGPLAARLREEGATVSVIPLPRALLGMNRRRAGRSLIGAALNAARSIPQVIRLARAIRRSAPDLVHATSLKADLIAAPASLLSRTPLVWHVHDRISDDYLPGTLVRLIRVLARLIPRAVIVNSHATAATLPGVRSLVVAYPGFSPDQVGPCPTERTWPAYPVVGILGRISPTKGQLEFVRAAALVSTRHPEVTFRIIGAPLFGHEAYAQEVRDEVRRLGIDDRVEFAGHADDPAAAIDALSLLVHASPTPEPFGQVIVEAMIRGLPVIATDAGGATEIMRPEPDASTLGWLVTPGEVAALADTIDDALSNPQEACLRAHRAYHSARERFTVAASAATVAETWATAAHSSQRRDGMRPAWTRRIRSNSQRTKRL